MAKNTLPEMTQEFHFYTMKKFPKILDDKIHVVHFLEATTDLLVLIDQLGNMFAPVKYDMQGNVDKIKKFYTYNEDTCLLALMLDEKSKGRDKGAEGVLWLNRKSRCSTKEQGAFLYGTRTQAVAHPDIILYQMKGLEKLYILLYNIKSLKVNKGRRSLLFFELVFEEIIKSLQRKEIDASIKTILTTAYNGSVKKYHNWVTQKIFYLILNISPSLPQMLKLLDPSQNMEEFEKRLIELHYCLKIIRCRIDTFFQENNMFVENK